ncbi:sugar transferase [Blautia sp. CLA-JM-H16]|uniref:Sugar transferase n=1 Tax=Blautia aquisgranensis TaxID=3133153 RepID=A0ABV1BIU8_9FIRM
MYQKENSSWVKHADFTICDMLCLQLAFILAYWIKNGVGHPYETELYRNVAVVMIFIQLVCTFFNESFSGVLRRNMLEELKKTFEQCTLVCLLVLVYMFLMRVGSDYSRMILLVSYVFYIGFSYCSRQMLKKFLKNRRYEEGEKRSMLIVTVSSNAKNIVETIRKNNYGTYHLAGIVLMDCDKKGKTIEGIPVVAGSEDIISYIHKNWVDEVFFAVPKEITIPEQIIKDCSTMGVVIHMQLATMKSLGKNQIVEEVAGYTVLSSSIRIVTPRQMFIKRTMDIVGGLVGCLFTGIVALFLVPAIKIKSPGPAFFSQVRVGKNGRPFKIYKFRSMYMDAEERKKELMKQNNVKDGMMFKMDDDPRIIKGVGHFIRKTSLDEFPQFWNILKGDMSLVGTRPPTVDEWEKYELHHRKRLAIRPGLTGMWQVSGRSDITDFEEVVELDTKYISEWCLKLDVEILFKTVMVVFMGSGAK